MAEILRPRDSDELRDIIHRTVKVLVDGGVAGFASECSYFAAMLAGAGSSGPRPEMPSGCQPVLFPHSVDEAFDIVPGLSKLGQKLARRCWPGPLILKVPATAARNGVLDALPQKLRSELGQETLALCVSSEPVLVQLARLLPAPLIGWMGPQPFVNGEALAQAFPAVDVVVESGPIKYEEGPTVVALQGNEWLIEREGVIRESSLKRSTAECFLFVCTGNTCRSPMAEGLFKSKLAERLKCSINELPERGFVVSSAGLAASYGSAASLETLELLEQRGIDLSGHESQPLTERLLNHADFVYTMTRGHRNAILSGRPDLADRVRLLGSDGSDVPDPIGSGMSEYVRCQQAIEKYLDAILEELVL